MGKLRPEAEAGNAASSCSDDFLSLGVGALTTLAAREAQNMRDDNRLHALFKSELDAVEDKLSRQMASFRGQLLRQGERLTEAFLNPIEAKVSALEGRERRIDCQLSDLNGSVKGLIDEVQLQVRRADKADAKFRHWRKLSEETYAKLEEQVHQRHPTGLLTGSLISASASPRAEPSHAGPAEASSEAVTRQELALVVERLRRELSQEIRTVVDAMLRDHLSTGESDASDNRRVSDSFDILRQNQQEIALELAQVTKQVKAEQSELSRNFNMRFDEFVQEMRRADTTAVTHVEPHSFGVSSLSEATSSKLKERVDILDAKVNGLLARPSGRDMESITERLARLASRVADLEQKERASRDAIVQQSPLRGSPSPAIPRLDLASVQNSSPVPSHQLAAWAECGTSPSLDPSMGTDVAAITSIVEDAVWAKLRGHFFKMVRSQEDLVDHLSAMASSSATDPGLLRVYKTLSEVVEIIAGSDEGDDNTQASGADAGSGRAPDALVGLWRDELAKLWRVLYDHVEHLEALLAKNVKEEHLGEVADVCKAVKEAGGVLDVTETPLPVRTLPEPESQPEPALASTLLVVPPACTGGTTSNPPAPESHVLTGAMANTCRKEMMEPYPEPRTLPPVALHGSSDLLIPPPPPTNTQPHQTASESTPEAPMKSAPLATAEALRPEVLHSLDVGESGAIEAMEANEISDCYISQAEVDEQWRLVRESSEALIRRKEQLDRSIAEVRVLAATEIAREEQEYTTRPELNRYEMH